MNFFLAIIIIPLLPLILFSQPHVQKNNSFDSNPFKVIGIQNIPANYMIVSVRDYSGRTVQFLSSSSQHATNNSSALTLGTIMLANFAAKTISPLSDTTIKYKIVKPVFSDQCCLISIIERDRKDSVDFVIAKTDTANGLTYFSRKTLTIDLPNIIAIGKPIYQMLFNNKRYATLKPLDELEVNKNIFYSYEFNFITRESYNTLRKVKRDTNFTPGNKDSILSLPVVDSSKRDLSPDVSLPIELSEILLGKNMVTGTLTIVVPVNVEYTIKIYSLPDHTLLYNSNKQQNFSLFPGMYEIEISGMILKNISVYKGMDTRLKAGTLSIQYNLPWVIYDANKVKIIYRSPVADKVKFPIGIYQLEIAGILHPIEIKDGETLEYDSTKQISKPIKLNIIDSNKIVQIPKSKISDSTNNKIIKNESGNHLFDEKNWEIKPNTSIKNATGRIFIKIPKDIECIISISQPNTGKEVYYSGALTNQRSFSLAPGTVDVKISGSTIKNVPVQKGMETRVKAGILNVVTSEIWTLYDEKKSKQIYFSTTAKKIGLPIGIYQIEKNGRTEQIKIKDSEILQF